MAKTTAKSKTPARAKAGAAKTKTKTTAKPAEAPSRKSGPEKGISRSPNAVYERSLRDMKLQAAKLHRQAERLMPDDKATAKAILATAKGLDKLIEKGSLGGKSKRAA